MYVQLGRDNPWRGSVCNLEFEHPFCGCTHILTLEEFSRKKIKSACGLSCKQFWMKWLAENWT